MSLLLLFPSSGAGHNILSLETGVYTVTGYPVKFSTVGTVLRLETGIYTFGGQNLRLLMGRTTKLAIGRYNVKGFDVGLSHELTFNLGSANYDVVFVEPRIFISKFGYADTEVCYALEENRTAVVGEEPRYMIVQADDPDDDGDMPDVGEEDREVIVHNRSRT